MMRLGMDLVKQYKLGDPAGRREENVRQPHALLVPAFLICYSTGTKGARDGKTRPPKLLKPPMDGVAIIRNQANIGAPISPQEMERMAKRRFQNPRPERRGAWWTMRVWRDEFIDGKHVRKQQRVRLAAATVSEREVKKIATEHLRPLNQGLESLGSATNFEHYIETIYKPIRCHNQPERHRQHGPGGACDS
jgi:hypothetical protein